MSDSSDPTPNPDNIAESQSPPVGGPPPPPPPPAMAISPAPVSTPGALANREVEVRQWAMFLHLSALAGLVVPMAGIVVPIVLWQVKKTEMPELDVHGRMVVNWMISSIIYAVASVVLILTVIGALIGIPMLMVLGVLAIVFPIIGGIKANDGQFWNYPITIKFL